MTPMDTFSLKPLPGEERHSRTDKSGNNRAEQTLRDSEMRCRRLFETAKDGILLLDAVSGKISDVNPFLIDLLGYTYKGVGDLGGLCVAPHPMAGRASVCGLL